jgi:hypothetical protein
MAITLDGTSGITSPNETITGSLNTPNTFGFKNRIINGGMVIDQRNAGASVTPVNGQYLVDRFWAGCSVASKYSVQQNAGAVTPPVGFTKYLGATSLSAYSVVSSDALTLRQTIEGFNIADLGWGTANAQTVTLSFWVRSSLTGTFGGALNNSGYVRSYPFTYTISVANTWEQKTIIIAGDTSGTWATGSFAGVIVGWSLGAGTTLSGTAGSWATATYTSATGAVSVVGTSGATFYITGVQLEKGSVATSFDQRAYSQELAMCQRYYQQVTGSNNYRITGQLYGTTAGKVTMPYYVTMRAAPTLTTNGLVAEAIGTGPTTYTAVANVLSGIDATSFDLTGGTARTAFQQLIYSGTVSVSAEL